MIFSYFTSPALQIYMHRPIVGRSRATLIIFAIIKQQFSSWFNDRLLVVPKKDSTCRLLCLKPYFVSNSLHIVTCESRNIWLSRILTRSSRLSREPSTAAASLGKAKRARNTSSTHQKWPGGWRIES